MFFGHVFETFDNATSTLTISNSSEFDERDKHSSEAAHVVIDGGVIEITNNAFYQWPLLISVLIGESVTSIGSSAFHYCSEFEIFIIDENMRTIGSYNFILLMFLID